MKSKAKKRVMKDGIERIEKREGASALAQLIRYNSGAVRYELDCAFKVLKRASKAMPDADGQELPKLVVMCAAANDVCITYFALEEALSAWLPAAVGKVVNAALEPTLLQAMNDFDNAVTTLKAYQ